MNNRKPKNKGRKPFIFLLFVALLAASGYLIWSFLEDQDSGYSLMPDKKPKVTWLKKSSEQPAIEEKITPEVSETPSISVQLAPEEDPTPLSKEEICQKTAEKIAMFFGYLDKQEYIQSYHLQGSSQQHFSRLVSKLLANPPVVARETDDLFAILNNMAHFFKILGADDILLIKDVLTRNQGLIESTMAIFFEWSEMYPDCREQTGVQITLPLANLYEYAGFFLNTLGGQSYLFRRDADVRILIKYYSILIVDRANDAHLNRYGIDIRYALEALIDELENTREVETRQEYLEKLYRLHEKYQAI